MDCLAGHATELLKSEEPVVLGGDYNVIPANEDCYDPAAWADDALFLPQTRAKFRTISISVTRKPGARCTAKAMSIPSGIIRPGPGRRTTASASTTSCSRPRPQTACRPARSTRNRAARKRLPITPCLVRTRLSADGHDPTLDFPRRQPCLSPFWHRSSFYSFVMPALVAGIHVHRFSGSRSVAL